jgi:hypothetical protein
LDPFFDFPRGFEAYLPIEFSFLPAADAPFSDFLGLDGTVALPPPTLTLLRLVSCALALPTDAYQAVLSPGWCPSGFNMVLLLAARLTGRPTPLA